ncbi:MAG: hypothetical protein AAFV45_12550 [Pseudomonadota bacterium]
MIPITYLVSSRGPHLASGVVAVIFASRSNPTSTGDGFLRLMHLNDVFEFNFDHCTLVASAEHHL